MKILLSAYACRPDDGSEPGVGWNWSQAVSLAHEVWVLTRPGNRGAIEGFLQRSPNPNVRFVYCDTPFWARYWGSRRWSVNIHYYLWQIGAYLEARKLYRKIDFDVIHHVTYIRYWMPSFLSFLPVPFVWGPVGGGESAPLALWPSLGLGGQLFEVCRHMARGLGKLDPFVRITARRAALALAATADSEKELRRLGCKSTKTWPAIALSQDEVESLGTLPIRSGKPLRVISLGRLLQWKGFSLGLRAFARLLRTQPGSEYWIIGEGPERRRLERLVRQLGLERAVKFWGWLPRRTVLEKLAQCDALLHPSLHDSGGWVCLEAMAAGRPVVCLDLGGPGLQVTDETGIKVAVTSTEQTIEDLADAMARLAANPELRSQLAAAGRRRISGEFHWEKKAQSMTQLYQEAMRSFACDRPAVTTESLV